MRRAVNIGTRICISKLASVRKLQFVPLACLAAHAFRRRTNCIKPVGFMYRRGSSASCRMMVAAQSITRPDTKESRRYQPGSDPRLVFINLDELGRWA